MADLEFTDDDERNWHWVTTGHIDPATSPELKSLMRQVDYEMHLEDKAYAEGVANGTIKDEIRAFTTQRWQEDPDFDVASIRSQDELTKGWDYNWHLAMEAARATDNPATIRTILSEAEGQLSEYHQEIAYLYGAIRDLHSFIAERLDPDPGDVEDYIGEPWCRQAAGMAGCDTYNTRLTEDEKDDERSDWTNEWYNRGCQPIYRRLEWGGLPDLPRGAGEGAR